MKLMIKEVCAHYHELELDDDVDLEELTERVKQSAYELNDCCEAVEEVMGAYEDDGVAYWFKPNNAGTDCVSIEIEQEDED